MASRSSSRHYGLPSGLMPCAAALQIILLFFFPMTAKAADPTSAASTAPETKTLAVADVQLWGLTLRTANMNDIRRHLWRIGGFLQARTTLRQVNVDRFYSWSRARDSYYTEFHYDPRGRFQWAVQVFRPHPHKSPLYIHAPSPLTTTDIMHRLRQQLGPPHRIQRRQALGLPGYFRYVWEDDVMIVVVDRVDGDPLQPVRVLYRLKRFSYDYDDKKT